MADSTLLQFRFDAEPDSPATEEVTWRPVTVPLVRLAGDPESERFSTDRHAEFARAAGIATASTRDELAFHAVAAVPSDDALEAVTRTLYGDLLARCTDLGCPNLVRVWNFVPAINRGVGDAENYVRFNAGRAAAFDRALIDESRYPAATVVGSRADRPLIVAGLASRDPAEPLENARQTAPYRYPRQYGVRAPMFARAILQRCDRRCRLLVSGTASIVGHESRHATLEGQIDETLANLRHLLDRSARAGWPAGSAGSRRWRVYLRHAGDLTVARPRLESGFGSQEQIVYLQADICRRELLVEVEGFCEWDGSDMRQLAGTVVATDDTLGM